MKKIISILLLATFCIFTQLHAQNRADELMKQAQENLTKKEYIKARYLFLQAYNAFATQDKYVQAVECGVNASALYHRENYYKEAFELLRGAEQVVATGEQKTGKAMPNLRFRINKERLQMYINLKNPARAKEQLTKLEETAKASHNDSLSNDLLYTQANYYYTFGMNTQGDAATNRLIELRQSRRMLQDSYQYRPQSKQCRTGGSYIRQVYPLDRLRESAYRTGRTERPEEEVR